VSTLGWIGTVLGASIVLIVFISIIDKDIFKR
jgi:hypothetical protein